MIAKTFKNFPYASGLAVVLLTVGLVEFHSHSALDQFAYDPNKGWFSVGLFTYCFLHANYLHLFCNLMAITLLPGLERLYGGKQILTVFFIGSLVGGIFHHLVSTNVIVGASGGLMAVAMLFFFTFPKQKILLMFIPVEALYAGVFIILISILGLYLPEQFMGHACHLGGMVVGLASTFFFVKPMEETRPVKAIKDTREPKLILIFAWLVLGSVSTHLQAAERTGSWVVFTALFFMITFYLGIFGRLRYPARLLVLWSLGVGFMAPHKWFLSWDLWVTWFVLAWGFLIWSFASYPGLIFLIQSIKSLGWHNGWRYYKLRQECQRDPGVLLRWAKRCRDEAVNSPHASHYIEFAETLESNYYDIQEHENPDAH